jgi:hypothetical protein
MSATATVAIAVAAGAFGGVLSFWGMFAFVEWVFARENRQRRRVPPRTLGPRGYRQHYDPLG